MKNFQIMEFSVLLIGDRGVGKASFINRCKSGKFTNVGPMNTYIDCKTNYGNIRLYMTQSRNYEPHHDADLIMFDLSTKEKFEIIKKIPQTGKPTVVVGNKLDLIYSGNYPKLEKKTFTTRKYPYYDISVKTNHRILSVIVCLLQQLIGDDVRLI